MAWFDCVCIFVCVCAHTKRTWRKNPMFCFCPLCFIFYGSYVKKSNTNNRFWANITYQNCCFLCRISGYHQDFFQHQLYFFCFRWLFYLLSTSFLFHLATDHRMFLCHCVSVYILAFVVFNGVVVVVFVCVFVHFVTHYFVLLEQLYRQKSNSKTSRFAVPWLFPLFPSLSFSNTLDTTPTTVCVHSIHLIMNTLLI